MHVFWDVMVSLGKYISASEATVILQDITNCSHDKMESDPRRPEILAALLWEPQASYVLD